MSARDVDFVPTTDVLLRAPCLAHVVELPVLGVPMRFETNSAWVRDVAEESFGAWRRAGTAPPGATPACVRVVVRDGTEHGAGHAPVRHICPDGARLLVQSPGSVAVADPMRDEAVAYVTTELAADREHFRVAVLEAITLALLAHRDRHPLHAAAIARDGHALLLAGPSGAGKSTLTWLAHDSGLDVLDDDRVWVQLAPTLRVWRGAPAAPRVRLRRDAASMIPEADRAALAPTDDGTDKLLLPLPDRGASAPLFTERATLCILEGAGARRRATLERIESPALVAALAAQLAAGFDRQQARHDVVSRALAEGGGWRLTLSPDPREALPHLLTMLAEG